MIADYEFPAGFEFSIGTKIFHLELPLELLSQSIFTSISALYITKIKFDSVL